MKIEESAILKNISSTFSIILMWSYVSVATIFLDGIFPRTVSAVQAHGGAEGLVVHQIGHFLFTVGMVYLLYRVVLAKYTGPGWTEFKGFLYLIIVWNCIAALGHMLREGIDPAQYVYLPGQATSFSLNHFSDYLFYLCSLDHLFLVPSFLFLATALKKWGESS